MVLQIPALKVKDHVKMLVFVTWAAYGVIPTCHWYFEMGGNESQMVQVNICNLYKLRESFPSYLYIAYICMMRPWNVKTIKAINLSAINDETNVVDTSEWPLFDVNGLMTYFSPYTRICSNVPLWLIIFQCFWWNQLSSWHWKTVLRGLKSTAGMHNLW